MAHQELPAVVAVRLPFSVEVPQVDAGAVLEAALNSAVFDPGADAGVALQVPDRLVSETSRVPLSLSL